MNYYPDARITNLGEGFYDEVKPAAFPKHELRFRNQRWAEKVGLGELSADEWKAHFARFDPLPGNLEKPLALRYHGHQFDVYNPQLGDGRGFLFAQLREGEGKDSRLLDLGTKGSGRTPWSRGGDGKLTLKGGVREVLATEMLEALGVNTSKTFSLFETGEKLMRGDEPSPTRSSVLVRLSHSHVRFGSFQRLSYARDAERLEKLLRYSIENYFPELAHSGPKGTPPSGRNPAHDFLAQVTQRTAKLAASFMVSGFVHGVLNSDNMVITGESFDYGPYRFLPTYDLTFVAAYFDETGLYAFGQQPGAMFRNVARLAESLRPIAPDLAIAPILRDFEAVLDQEINVRLLDRLGLKSNGVMDSALMEAVYTFLSGSRIGYDQFFFDLYGGALRSEKRRAGKTNHFYVGEEWAAIEKLLELYAPVTQEISPYYSADEPCTLLIDEIESIWSAIAQADDWSLFADKISRIRAMGAARVSAS
ncbi:MAG: protein adenylyltransferase SelO family protein [Polyangiaceae bacterium]